MISSTIDNEGSTMVGERYATSTDDSNLTIWDMVGKGIIGREWFLPLIRSSLFSVRFRERVVVGDHGGYKMQT